MLGASRKSFLKAIHPGAADVSDRLGGSLAVVLAGARSGVAVVETSELIEENDTEKPAGASTGKAKKGGRRKSSKSSQ